MNLKDKVKQYIPMTRKEHERILGQVRQKEKAKREEVEASVTQQYEKTFEHIRTRMDDIELKHSDTNKTILLLRVMCVTSILVLLLV